jgi:hypothetical protein
VFGEYDFFVGVVAGFLLALLIALCIDKWGMDEWVEDES